MQSKLSRQTLKLELTRLIDFDGIEKLEAHFIPVSTVWAILVFNIPRGLHCWGKLVSVGFLVSGN